MDRRRVPRADAISQNHAIHLLNVVNIRLEHVSLGSARLDVPHIRAVARV